jgi:hypothetical protein
MINVAVFVWAAVYWALIFPKMSGSSDSFTRFIMQSRFFDIKYEAGGGIFLFLTPFDYVLGDPIDLRKGTIEIKTKPNEVYETGAGQQLHIDLSITGKPQPGYLIYHQGVSKDAITNILDATVKGCLQIVLAERKTQIEHGFTELEPLRRALVKIFKGLTPLEKRYGINIATDDIIVSGITFPKKVKDARDMVTVVRIAAQNAFTIANELRALDPEGQVNPMMVFDKLMMLEMAATATEGGGALPIFSLGNLGGGRGNQGGGGGRNRRRNNRRNNDDN